MMINDESIDRHWIVWSKPKSALFCLPCETYSKHYSKQKSILAETG